MFPNWSFILLLRLRQMGRILREGGWRLWLLLPVILIFLALTVRDATLWSVPWFNAILVYLLLMLDWQRGDKKLMFLLPRGGYLLRLSEYAIVLFLANVYAIFLNVSHALYLLLAIIFIAVGMSFTRERSARFRLGFIKQLIALLPPPLYDIKSGLRQAFLFFVLLWIAGLFACWYLPAISFVVALFLMLLIEVMLQPEPVVITQSHRTVHRAVHRKIGVNILFFFLLLLPHFLISIWRFHDFVGWISSGVSLWLLCVCVTYSVLLKYSRTDGGGSYIINGVKIAMFVMISPLVPVTLYLIHQEYQRALCRLKPLLN